MKKYSFGEKFRAVLATGRVANIPTVWSNVLVGFLMTISVVDNKHPVEVVTYSTCCFMIIGASFLYVGGCMLGDYRDLAFDKKHRPSRPIPLGILSPQRVAISGYVLLLFGFIITSLTLPLSFLVQTYNKDYLYGSLIDIKDFLFPSQMWAAFILSISILIYAIFHKRMQSYALINMALCRFFLIIYTSLTFLLLKEILFIEPDDKFSVSALIGFIFAIAVGLYTFTLSSVASTESSPEKFQARRLLSIALLTIPLLSLLTIGPRSQLTVHKPLEGFTTLFPEPHLSVLVIAIIICTSWSLYALKALDTSKPTFVSRALAGFCLLDACFAATFSLTLAVICLGLFCLALLLQRVAPAT